MDQNITEQKLEYAFEVIRNDIFNKFMKLKTHEERFALVLESLLRHFSHLYIFKCKKKLTEHSIRSREDGNQCFVAGHYLEAVKKYTESILYADKSSEEIALAYANRSAALFELEKFEDCIKDIERALNLNYPDRLKTKLYKRKGLCLVSLDMSNANSSFREAMIWLDKTTLSQDERNRIENELRILMSISYSADEAPKKAIQLPFPQILEPNPKIPSASDAVAVKYSKKFGRHLVATRQIKPGEILILEEPYCKRLYAKFVYTNCSYCLLASWALIPCSYCVNVAYCSEACKDKAWEEYHEVECTVVGPLLCFQVLDQICLSMRMAIVATKKGTKLDALRQELIGVDQNSDPCKKLYSDDGKLRCDRYRSIHCSQANGDDDTCVGKLISQATWVAITVCILASESNMFGKKLALDTLAKNPDVTFVGELMFKHLHLGAKLKTHRMGSDSRSGLIEYGHSLMALGSLLNHSCDANTSRQQRADLKSAYFAVYPIREGEQIFDNYGPEFHEMEMELRQMYCIGWNFYCECRPCIENWPQLANIPSYKQQPLTRQNKKKLDTVMQEFKKCNFLLQKNIGKNEPNTINELEKMVEILFRIAKRPCKEMILANIILKFSRVVDEAVLDYVTLNQTETEIQCEQVFSRLKHQMLQ